MATHSAPQLTAPQTPASSAVPSIVDALPLVDRVVRDVARRYRLTPDARDDFRADVLLRLLEDDAALLRKFEGRSSLQTYLRTVVTRLFLDTRVRAWGRWRPTAQAVRLGSLAVALEYQLTCRRLSLTEAIETLCARDASLTRDRVRAVAATLPVRSVARRLVDDVELETLPSVDPDPQVLLESRDECAQQRRIGAVLRRALDPLSPLERRVIALRFGEGLTVADIARRLGVAQKPLYGRLERTLRGLRRQLEAAGISAADLT